MAQSLAYIDPMRRYPILVTAAAVALLTGCTPTTETPSTETGTPSPTSTEPSPTKTTSEAAAQVSRGGVTTAVDAPANATESGYGQACLAARGWMAGRPEAPAELAEAYLKTLQEPGAVGPGTFNLPWAELSPGQQSGVIMAVNSAAAKECG